MKFKKILSSFMIIIATLTLFVGCGKSKDDKGKNIGSSNLPEVVNIGTQQMPNDEKIAIAKGFFEEELGVKVNIVEFNAGDIRNAMISKNIDFALLGSASATLGIASGMDAEVIWIHEVLGDAEKLVAKNNSNINSIKDIVGKKIATPFSTTAHYSLLKALELNNIPQKDVTIYDMQMSDIYAAWKRGDIDAAYAWEPTLSSLLEDGKVLVSSKELAKKGIVTSNVEIVRRDFAEKYPDIVSKYIKAVDKAVKLYKENEGEAVKTVADALHITEEEALKQMQGSVWLTAKEQLDAAYFGTKDKKGDLVNSLKDIADFLYDQKSLMTKPELSTFEKAVNPSYIENALK
ncbi:aliphatic sulfonate ABC transporter substrate-binding protein [Clostridium cochlearium]|uniref:taurine ABC transporter substrate-binding protein n=1 Tax=Clostridium cochlearium TaxID=1494 RepID=UPI000B948A50|nr:aliphatic sulfonate ABC transporter substrate-binding protein [Clostridium cochlearium]MCR1970524.1 aliphatic sulfonate ABC transporter substrate-binding protein [Clostridium cochlearium]MDU1443062.1 aliphatic sulfonate ABC transporter substrate-binding protein [Clostridium cochlearium]SNV77781.1 taurine-binding periplasmic protein precursor [Clostridium cochlearium]STA92665.1 taurine-binding periplasmic protein precursor [Clostridium cochlearium]